MAALIPRWTTEKPTHAGWYWLRRGQLVDVEVVQIYPSFNVQCAGEDVVVPLADFDDEHEWSGPLDPPA